MVPRQTPSQNEKGILSELQEAWSFLREAVLMMPSSEKKERLLFLIDEEMPYEGVRHLNTMRWALSHVACIAKQQDIGEKLRHRLLEVCALLDVVYERLRKGERL